MTKTSHRPISIAKPKTSSGHLKRRRPSPLALEQRFMFDGAAVATVDVVHHSLDHAGATADTVFINALAGIRAATVDAPTAAPRDIAFVDTRVSNWQSLVGNIRPGIEVVLIQPSDNGIATMLSTLKGQTGIDAIYIVGHGASGTAELGSSVLTNDDLGSLQNQLTTIGASLAPHGDILLYGCDIGAGKTGQDFVTHLSQLTGADVAASTDATGAARLGGNWALETQTGLIEAPAL